MGRSQARRGRAGFSLLELVLVLVILGLLATVGTLAVGPLLNNAKIATTKSTMGTIKTAITSYQLQNGSLPASIQAMVPNYLEAGNLNDDWEQPLYYLATPGAAEPYQLISGGPDMEIGTEDDISVWELDNPNQGG